MRDPVTYIILLAGILFISLMHMKELDHELAVERSLVSEYAKRESSLLAEAEQLKAHKERLETTVCKLNGC